ncbi:outer membrane protein assembly factor BamB family protein [Nocardiopsis suaedae]|uniref:PQQ-binding-like beta-propeller repeat protein n=1 Tax=Nocardiopsis suaedae TaxID=3018444 RepID=A0ABT4TQI8_9ACTN|nr:PQQ-binding-like beta-propeller repeat protein [Nocardiopsis suaedae]MDA2806955.1 PQQ-binding-like beta-propeller repeat protein [Nocardiopsis suaedae]
MADEDRIKKLAREARRNARKNAGGGSGGGSNIPRDEWGVPLDPKHVRSGLYARESRLARMGEGPKRKDFKRLFTLKRLPFLAAGLAASVFVSYYWGSQNITAIFDPPMKTEGESTAAVPVWEAPADDVHRPGGATTDFDEVFALWPGGGGAVRADRAGVTAYGVEDGSASWRFTEGEGLCAAAQDPAGEDGGLALVIVEREGGAGDDGALCDTLVALDLDTGEERWRWEVPELNEAEGIPGRDVHVWADGPRALAAWGPLLVGVDAADGETLWAETGIEGPGEDCVSHGNDVMTEGGSAAVAGSCETSDGTSAPFAARLDTATGEVSGVRAFPTDMNIDFLSSVSVVSTDPLAVVHASLSSELSSLLSDGDGDEEPTIGSELLIADGEDGWKRIDATQESGYGAASEEWRLGDSETALASHDGVLYASPGNWSADERMVAIDLEAGEILWNRRVDEHAVQVVGADDRGVLAVAEYGDSTEEETRVLRLPLDGEGRARVLATGLPEQSYNAAGAVHAVEIDGGFAVGAPTDPYDDGPVVPLTAAR